MQSQKQAATAAAATITSAATDATASTPTTTANAELPTRNQMRPVKFDYADSFACTYIVSVVAASNAELVTYPLDLTKTRLQIQGEAAASAHHAASGSKTAVPQVSISKIM